MENFVAIDFETANGNRSSVCSVGIVVVRDGEIVDKYYSLIQPTPNFYTRFTTAVHGLTKEDTGDARQFPQVWAELSAHLPEDFPLVAHNSPFDESCLRAVFEAYDMDYPEYPFFLYLSCLSSHIRRAVAQSSTPHGGRTLRFSPQRSPPRAGRCRGLRLDCPRDL